ncbi:hypothetical protein X271_00551 [Candidatus Hepatoplasma crinochetorum Av]|uniref:Uncharacterized protein n=1 Tax=Candidatus Hepatoplasma crinochetorum Av TaxID=1427984 RepID=W8GNP0_9MOLU|nr:hypothetical protein [Candidatus Hepatoplasma crinochetorum]AHK22651.1 hypothetical protein X271_00551 [Candidatus Hepatoplasma crinochetorum Av]
MNQIIERKIKFLKQEFSKNNYVLLKDDIKDLKIQLERKPVQLYNLAIKFLLKNNEKINYENISKIIIIDIRIRDNLKKIITSLEEYIRVKYIDFKKIEFNNNLIKKIYTENLAKMIQELKVDEYNIIREIRNKVNHIVYPIIFEEFKNIFNNLIKIRNLDFINKNTFDKYLRSILNTNYNININFINNSFKKLKNYI